MPLFNNTYLRILAITVLIYASIFTEDTFNIHDGSVEIPSLNPVPDLNPYPSFLRLEIDMSLYEVEAILGQGVRVSVEDNLISYHWQFSRDRWIVCIFNSDLRLVSFQQQGLD